MNTVKAIQEASLTLLLIFFVNHTAASLRCQWGKLLQMPDWCKLAKCSMCIDAEDVLLGPSRCWAMYLLSFQLIQSKEASFIFLQGLRYCSCSYWCIMKTQIMDQDHLANCVISSSPNKVLDRLHGGSCTSPTLLGPRLLGKKVLLA